MILGQWKSNFYVGYCLPLEDYLITKGSHHFLQVNFGFIFKNIVAKEYSLKIIVPEGATGLSADLPFPVSS